MKQRLLSKLSVFLFIVILFYSISFSFTTLNVNAGALTAIDGIHSFGNTYFAYDGSSSATSLDGNFTINTNKYTFASDPGCAWINDMTMAGTEEVIITVGKNKVESNGADSLRSFKLNKVDVGEFGADGIYSVTIIGYIGVSEVFRTETYIDGMTGSNEHYSLNMSNALDKVIDNFKIFYTKGEGTGFAHENFTLYSFEISEASSDAPPDVTAPSVVSITRQTPTVQLTNASSVTYLVTFSESVIGVDNNDFRLTGTAAGTIAEFSEASGAAIEVTVNNISGDGILELECIGTGITDAEGNEINKGFDIGEYYIIDKSVPRVDSIIRLTPEYELTNASSVVYRVTFNEDVSGVDTTDFKLNKTLDAAGTIFSTSKVGTRIVDLTVNGISGNGTLGLECIGTGITDTVGNEINEGFIGQTYIIDTAPPAVISQSPADDAAGIDKTSNLTITFSENVSQNAGNILLKKTFDGSTVDTVLTGWGTSTIIIDPTNDLTEKADYYVLIDSNAVIDSAGNYFAGISDAAEWNFTIKDSTPPALTAVSTINKTYKAGDDILITCIFNENVTVNAGGSIKLNIGGAEKIALYDAQLSLNTLQYKYTVEAGINDTDGITIVSLDSSDIKDLSGNSADITLNGVADTSGILIDGTAPYIDDDNAAAVYNSKDNTLIFKVTENQSFGSGIGLSAVDVSKLTVKDGANFMTLTIGQSTAVITDPSTITVTIGGTDLTAIEAFSEGERISSLDAEAGAVTDAAGNACAADNGNVVSTQVSMSISADTAMTEENLDARYINVTLYGTRFIDAALANANFTINNAPTGLTVESVVYTSSNQCRVNLAFDDGTDFDTDISNLNVSIAGGELAYGAPITSGNSLSITSYQEAAIISVSNPADGAYKPGDTLSFTVNFSKLISVTGSPYITLNLSDGSTVNAAYIGGTGTDALIFSYTIPSGQAEVYISGIGSDIMFSWGTIRDASGIDAELKISGTSSTTSIKLDGIAPMISSLTPADGEFCIGVNSDLIMTFNENVSLGSGNIVIRNSSSTAIETIAVTDTTKVSVSTNTVTINPSTTLEGESVYYVMVDSTAIRDIAGNYFAGITDISTWAFATEDITPPVVISRSPADNAADIDKTSNLTITFDDIVLQDSGSILLKKTSDGSTVDTVITGWGTSTITINPTNNLTEKADYYVLIDSNAVMDIPGNYFAGISDAAEWNFTVKDSTPPAVTSVSTINKTYKAGDDILITCIFNENVTVNAGGSIKLNIGGAEKIALYDAQLSLNTLQYKYIVEAGVNDTDGITIVSLDGINVSDEAGNSAIAALGGISDTLALSIDGTAPTIDDSNAASVYSSKGNTLIFKVSENQGLGTVDVSKLTVRDGANFRTLTIGQSTAVITDSSTITVTIGGTDLTAIEAFSEGEKISSLDAAAGAVTDAAGNASAVDSGNIIYTETSMAISADAAMTEENLDIRYINVTLYGTRFVDAALDANNFNLLNKPAGLQIENVEYISEAECIVRLAFDGRDFDTSIANFNISIHANELACSTDLTSHDNLLVTATADTESLTISGNINEGAENIGEITVDIIGGTFNTITPANWTVNNLPQGVTVEGITKTDSNTVIIKLWGNSTKDYDSNITNVSVSCTAAEFSESDSGASVLSANTGAVFIAVNDSEAIEIADGGFIREREEGGKTIYAVIIGGTIESTSTSDWMVNNLPSGVTVGTITKTGRQSVTITLAGNSTEDYDADITNITVSCSSLAYSDSEGALTSSNSITFHPKLAPLVQTKSSLENLLAKSVTINGYIASDGNDTILERGIEYKKSGDTSYTSAAALTLGIGDYSVNITGLYPNTVYTARAYARNYEGTSYGSDVNFTTGKTDNADLSSLTLSSGTITFNPATVSYNVSVLNSAASLTITPTASEPTAVIKVNGIEVTGGTASQPINLSVGSNTVTIEVISDNGATTKTYTLTVNRAAAPAPTPSSPSTTTGLSNIIINGTNNSMASIRTEGSGNDTVTTVRIDKNRLGAYLDTLPEQSNSIVIPVNTNANTVVCRLSSETINNMAEHDTILEVRTSDVSYSVPLSNIDLQSAMRQLGLGATLNNSSIDIKIKKPDAETVKVVEDAASSGNYTLVVQPINFEINITLGDRTAAISEFNGFVERTIAIPDGVDPAKITTGVVLNSDGTFSHVPTTIIKVNGKYYARINSLTNSTYSVIWNEVSFKDMEGHWAEEIVNDLGSRLVLTGTDSDTFGPDIEITRAEFAAIIVKALGLMRPDTGKEVFSDVDRDDWYFDAVSIAYEHGIVKGFNGAFKPEAKITREEAMTMLSRAMDIAKLENNLSGDMQNALMASFTDGDKVASWARNSVAACLDREIIIGLNNNIMPKKNITRAETAVMISRMLKAAGLI